MCLHWGKLPAILSKPVPCKRRSSNCLRPTHHWQHFAEASLAAHVGTNAPNLHKYVLPHVYILIHPSHLPASDLFLVISFCTSSSARPFGRSCSSPLLLPYVRCSVAQHAFPQKYTCKLATAVGNMHKQPHVLSPSQQVEGHITSIYSGPVLCSQQRAASLLASSLVRPSASCASSHLGFGLLVSSISFNLITNI